LGQPLMGHTAHAGNWQRQRWCLGHRSASQRALPWTETVGRLESLTLGGRQLNIATEMLQNLGDFAGQAM